MQTLSVVPDAVRAWIDVSTAQYLSMGDLVRLKEDETRAIDRPQMELVADSTGIPLDEVNMSATADIQKSLKLARFESTKNSLVD